jgi:signal transduction histidine kinase
VEIRVSIQQKELSEEPDQERDFVQISVIDTGIGIDKKDHDKLFKLFGFVNDHKQMNTKGIGLGLMIAQQIVN